MICLNFKTMHIAKFINHVVNNNRLERNFLYMLRI